MLSPSFLRISLQNLANTTFLRITEFTNTSSAALPGFCAVLLIALLSVPVSDVVSRAVETTDVPSTITYG